LMAAAMVGGGARPRQATAIAAAVALMHTASVLVLGVAVLGLERTFRPEALYPWLGVASGLAAFAVGAYLLRTRWTRWKLGRGHLHHGDDHGHLHGHAHAVDAAGVPAASVLSRQGIVALAFAGGALPAPSALLVMLGAIQAHRTVYGMSLVLAFSAGLAVALLVVGLGALRARDAVSRRLSGRAAVLAPVLSAVAILFVGVFLTVRAATQM